MSATTPPGLSAIVDHITSEPGLIANIYAVDIQGGADAAALMNSVFATAIEATGVNTDGILTPADLRAMSDYIRANQSLYSDFVEGHGNDEGNVETGYHLVQGDGGAYRFQGRDFINTIIDAIYHIGFEYGPERFLNEDGNDNEKVEDVAGWLNYFVNGENRVYGTNDGETLRSGSYSFALDDAANEIFNARGGNDAIWAGMGNDKVYGGDGNDRSGGGQGRDTLRGEAGNDTLGGNDGNDLLSGGSGADALYGDEGNDRVFGGSGTDNVNGGDGNDALYGGNHNDTLGGDAGRDTLRGEAGDDHLYGEEGNDILSGSVGNDYLSGGDGEDLLFAGSGNDTAYGGMGDDNIRAGTGNDRVSGNEGDDFLRGERGDDTISGGEGDDTVVGSVGEDSLHGGDDDDRLFGGSGNDTLKGGEGRDHIVGGSGVDELADYEEIDVTDTFVFDQGDTGVGEGNRDIIRGFNSGIDQIDLTDYDGLALQFGATFAGNGSGAIVFTGNLVRIDADGDGVADAEIQLAGVSAVQVSDFIL